MEPLADLNIVIGLAKNGPDHKDQMFVERISYQEKIGKNFTTGPSGQDRWN
jgi:hypothetical protein